MAQVLRSFFPYIPIFGYIAIVATAVALTLPRAHALVINFATGQDGSGNIQTAGDSLDANWKEKNANNPKLAPNTYVVSPWGNGSADWYWEWFYNGPNSSWIAPNPDNAFGNGSFTLTYTFDLTGYDLSTASFNGLQWSIDDRGNVQLNGHTEASQPSLQWGSFHGFTIPITDLVQGINTLTINSVMSDNDFEAARFEGKLTIGPATSLVPEPTSLALLGAALAGFAFARLRCSRA